MESNKAKFVKTENKIEVTRGWAGAGVGGREQMLFKGPNLK